MKMFMYLRVTDAILGKPAHKILNLSDRMPVKSSPHVCFSCFQRLLHSYEQLLPGSIRLVACQRSLQEMSAAKERKPHCILTVTKFPF